jgi:curved DNA-binding protein CbpA
LESATHYDVLGIRPDASHREVVHAFSRLAEHYSRESASNPSARETFQRVKLAYETLTKYESRLRYNIEHGFPDPPRPGKEQDSIGLLGAIDSMLPENWPVLLPWLALVIGGNMGYYLMTGRLPWGFVWHTASSDADRLIYIVGTLLFVTLAALLSRRSA